MTNADVKKMLYDYPNLDKYIRDCEKELQEIQDKISVNYDVAISVISDMPHGTGISDKTYNAVANIEKIKETFAKQVDAINKEIQDYYKEKRKIESILRELSPMQRNIVELFYFKNMSWTEIYLLDKKNNPETYRTMGTWTNESTRTRNKIRELLTKKTGD